MLCPSGSKYQQRLVKFLFALVVFGSISAKSGSALPSAHEDRIVLAESEGSTDAGHGGKKAQEPAADLPIPKAVPQALAPADQYCAKIGDIAINAQFAQQRKALANAQQQVEDRIKTLNEKSEEYQLWAKKREDFMKKATDGLLEIYGKMKPEVAATQLVAMSQVTAAAIVARLPPKAASAILAEMDAAHAARLSTVLAGAAELDAAPPSAAQKDKP